MSPFLLSQILAALAFAAGLAAFQFRARPSILRSWSLCAALNGAHFLLLGVPGAATLAAMISVRFLIASFTSDRRIMAFFMILAVAGFLATFTRPVGFLALASTLLGTWASFQPNDRTVRATLAVCASLWVVHNAIIGSPVATVMELSFLASNAIGWRRFHGRAKMAAAPLRTVRTDDEPEQHDGD
jgi:hypothetical protein